MQGRTIGEQGRQTTLVDSAYHAIREQILGHVLEPERRLGIDRLAGALGVSQTPVREALSRLAAEGLAVYVPMSGYRVTPVLDAMGFDRLMEARYAIEPQLAALAARRMAAERAQQLRHIAAVEGTGGDGDRYESYRERTDRDRQFHMEIAIGADNAYLSDALASLQPHLHLYRLHNPSTGLADTTDEHLGIVDAIASGDPRAARDAMRRHLDSSYHRHAAGLAL